MRACVERVSLPARLRSILYAGMSAGLLALTPFSPALALDPHRAITQYNIDRWGPAEGLPQPILRRILQTRNGYLWLAGQGGLVRFDGVEFRLYDRSNTPDLPSDDVRHLQQSRNGDLWLSTYGGGLVRMRAEQLTVFTTREGLASDLLRCSHEDRQGAIWACTSKGLTRLFGGAARTYTTADGLPGDVVFALLEDRSGALWVGTSGGAARRRDGAFEQLLPGRELAPGTVMVTALHEDPQGRIWIGTYGGGVSVVGPGNVVTYTTRDGLADDRVLGISGDSDGNLWIATYAKGVQRFRDGRFSTLGAEQGLSNSVFHVLEDREGNLWVAAVADGLYRLQDGRFVTYSATEGLGSGRVYAVLSDSDGTLWVGTEGEGLHRLHDGEITTLTTANGLSSDNVVSLARGRDGSLWVGTFGGGVNRLFQGRSSSLTTRQGLPHDAVFALREDRQGALWVGTQGGLARLQEGELTTFGEAEGLVSRDVRCLLEDRHGSLWVGTNGGGLSRFDGDRFATFGKSAGLGSEQVFALLEDSQGVLWVGTKGGGVARYEGGRFTTFDHRHGLWDDTVWAMLEDDAGSLWLSSPKGISRIARESFDAVASGRRELLQVERFDRSAGIRIPHVVGGSQPGAWRAADGRLWFATFDGVVTTMPATSSRNLAPPPPRIHRILLGEGEAVDPAPRVELPVGQRRIEIHYAALSLRAPEKVRYRFRLDGIDHGWVDAASRRAAYYTNLPAGRFRFRLEAADEAGTWVSAEHLELVVPPLTHETAGFRLLLVLGLAAGGGTVYRLRTQRLRRREAELHARVEQQLARIKILRGLLPICACCKKVRDDNGYWNQLELYIRDHSEAEFSHGVCPGCLERVYGLKLDAETPRDGQEGGEDPSNEAR